ncbi:MAG: hypothetical protein GY811_05310 [Myxococcales bacterium]|nr:hypothetical protein [Myxococcales bacterium]
MSPEEQAERSGRAASNEDGSVYVEYIILVGVFGLVMAVAVFALGQPLLRFFQNAQLIWAGPFP